jgi:hypothetical protein
MDFAHGVNGSGRHVGYEVPGTCDHKGCAEPIVRSVTQACGGHHDGSTRGCGEYFCNGHIFIGANSWTEYLCGDCYDRMAAVSV